MKLKKRPKFARKKKFDALTHYNIIIIMTALFISGLIIGAIIVKNGDAALIAGLSRIFTGYRLARGGQSPLATFSSSMLINMLFLAASFTFGMCCVGAPAVCALPFIRGVGMGVVAAYIYNAHAFYGAGYFVLVLLPGAAVSISLMLISCNESYKTSVELLRFVNGSKQLQSGVVRRYLNAYLAIMALSAAGSLLDAAMNGFFAHFFNL